MLPCACTVHLGFWSSRPRSLRAHGPQTLAPARVVARKLRRDVIHAVTNGNFEVLNRSEWLSATLEPRGEQRSLEREHEREVENNSGIQSRTRALRARRRALIPMKTDAGCLSSVASVCIDYRPNLHYISVARVTPCLFIPAAARHDNTHELRAAEPETQDKCRICRKKAHYFAPSVTEVRAAADRRSQSHARPCNAQKAKPQAPRWTHSTRPHITSPSVQNYRLPQ